MDKKEKAERAAYMRAWYAANPDKAKKNAQASYLRHKKKRNAEARDYYEKHKDAALEYSKARYERDKQDPEWRAKRAEYQKAYRAKNREKVNAKRRAYLGRNKDKQQKWSLVARSKHGDKMNAATRQWSKENTGHARQRYATDEQYRLSNILSARFRAALRGNRKSGRAIKLLGCSIEEFRRHIEAQWQPGMTWENHRRYGWHLDHIRPLNSFDLSDPEQQAMACHYTNMQPLWWRENISKRDRWEGAP